MDTYHLSKKNENAIHEKIEILKTKILKQIIVVITQKKTCENKKIYKNYNKIFLKTIKKV